MSEVRLSDLMGDVAITFSSSMLQELIENCSHRDFVYSWLLDINAVYLEPF